MSSSLIDLKTGRVLETIPFGGDLSRTDIIRSKQSQSAFEHETALIVAAKLDESDRIRSELIDWLIGDISPCDAGLINGRRIVDEIDRICPKEQADHDRDLD